MTRPATNIHAIADKLYQDITDGKSVDIEVVRRGLYEIKILSKDINASYGIPDPTVTQGRRIHEPFLPINEGDPIPPLVAIADKMQMGQEAAARTELGEPEATVFTVNTPLRDSSLLAAPTHEEIIIPSPSPTKWTNSTLREELGKRGFLEDPTRKNMSIPGGKEVRTFFVRRGYEVILVESESNPHLLNILGQLIDVKQMAHRNINMRQPTEGGKE